MTLPDILTRITPESSQIKVIHIPRLADDKVVPGNLYQYEIIKQLHNNPKLQERLQSKLHTNSEVSVLKPVIFGETQNRPLSAYYYLMDKEIVMEAGLIDSSGKSAIHKDLFNATGHFWRRNNSLVRYSGHIWHLPDKEVSIALFDCQAGQSDWQPRMETMVKTLASNGFVCVGSSGQPITPFVSSFTFTSLKEGEV